MEFDENNEQAGPGEAGVEIYSKKAVWWFAVLLSPLFGGVLLMLNLKAAGYKRAVYEVLIFSVLYALASELLIDKFLVVYKVNFTVVNTPMILLAVLSISINIIGALILTQYFFRKYFPDNDYYPKSVTAPVLIAILVVLLVNLLR
jgi:hypothetical protein